MARSVGINLDTMLDELPFNIYDFWLHSIRRNDTQAVENTLDIVDDEQKKKLLNGKFIFPDSDDEKKQNDPLNFTRAWSIAVSSVSYDVIGSFVRHGVDPCVLYRDENNILHVLIYAAFTKPEEEDKMRDVYAYIQSIISPDIILRMLKMTNVSGLI